MQSIEEDIGHYMCATSVGFFLTLSSFTSRQYTLFSQIFFYIFILLNQLAVWTHRKIGERKQEISCKSCFNLICIMGLCLSSPVVVFGRSLRSIKIATRRGKSNGKALLTWWYQLWRRTWSWQTGKWWLG